METTRFLIRTRQIVLVMYAIDVDMKTLPNLGKLSIITFRADFVDKLLNDLL
jgi:hypothetical protein